MQHQATAKHPSHYALQVWTMVARHGMTPSLAAQRLAVAVE